VIRERFVDHGRWLGAFAGEFIVRCPRCADRAKVLRQWDHQRRRWMPATVACTACGFARRHEQAAGCECGRCERAASSGWAGPVIVAARRRCGQCGRWMQIRRRAKTAPASPGLALRCDGCGAATTTCYSVRPVTVPDALVDNCFGLPLWLQTPCAGHTVWAFNARHLAYLKEFLEADLRERRGTAGNASVISRLPAWMKSAKHRDEARRAVRRLEHSLTTAH
jgi:hypothetical protein